MITLDDEKCVVASERNAKSKRNAKETAKKKKKSGESGEELVYSLS